MVSLSNDCGRCQKERMCVSVGKRVDRERSTGKKVMPEAA